MHVEMEMRYLLAGALAGGMPDAQTVGREDRRDGPCDTGDGRSEGHRGLVVDGPNVAHVFPGNDQGVPGMELAQIQEREGIGVLKDETRALTAGHDVAEGARAP